MTGPAAVLETLLDTGVPIVVPGIARWLGVPDADADPDESYEAFLDRISKEPVT